MAKKNNKAGAGKAPATQEKKADKTYTQQELDTAVDAAKKEAAKKSAKSVEALEKQLQAAKEREQKAEAAAAEKAEKAELKKLPSFKFRDQSYRFKKDSPKTLNTAKGTLTREEIADDPELCAELVTGNSNFIQPN